MNAPLRPISGAMILTPIALNELDTVLARYGSALPEAGIERAVFERIAASRTAIGGDEAAWHRDAVALAGTFGMHPVAEEPQRAFSWDGKSVRTLSEPAVLLHEVAHFQLASPARRRLPDFGLGAGPETGRVAIADAALCVEPAQREAEEQQASLLGILWEVELDQPAILAFQEQNWLEGAGRPSCAEFFTGVLRRLSAAGLIDEDGRPCRAVRITP
ncbi:MAG TPA: hypothetical protein VM689_02510 [Aliidongia sp.]|nr:hypothetical protein [Aliidongia sp.]